MSLAKSLATIDGRKTSVQDLIHTVTICLDFVKEMYEQKREEDMEEGGPAKKAKVFI